MCTLKLKVGDGEVIIGAFGVARESSSRVPRELAWATGLGWARVGRVAGGGRSSCILGEED